MGLAAGVALAAAAVADWTRPPQEQASVFLYEKAVVWPYRGLIRPASALLVRCRYIPTCSQFSVEAVRAYGLPKGLWLTAKRLLRCMPWVPMHTWDPVPPPRSPQPNGQAGEKETGAHRWERSAFNSLHSECCS